MAKIRTHYDNLKVAVNAPDSVIRAAYKALCQKYHPDKYQGSKEEGERILKIVRASYQVLSDPGKRARHDDWIKEQEAGFSQQVTEFNTAPSLAKDSKPAIRNENRRPLKFNEFQFKLAVTAAAYLSVVAVLAYLVWNSLV